MFNNRLSGEMYSVRSLLWREYSYHGPTTNMKPLNKELGRDVFIIHLPVQVSNNWPLTKIFNPDMAALQLFSLT